MGATEDLDPSPFGLDVHAAHDLIPLFGGIGIRWFRVDLDWDEVEPEAGRLDWTSPDRVVETADESGVSLLMSVAYTPQWASAPARRRGLQPDEARTLPPADPELFVRFLHLVLERYGAQVQAMSVWNEPDFEQFWMGTLDEYLALWAAGLDEIRRTSPAMVIGGPDLSTWSEAGPIDVFVPRPERRWLARILDRAGCRSESPMIDVVTHHQYGAGDTPAGRVAAIEDLHRFLVPHCRAVPPIWVTETGFPTDKVSKEGQARHLRAVFEAMAARSSWWKKTFWYDSHGQQGRAEWGLLGPRSAPDARKPRPAFRAYGEVIRAAGGAPAVSRAAAQRRVDLAYRGILGRDPDPTGHAIHARLAQTRSMEAVCDALLSSEEFRQRERQVSLEDIASGFLAVARGRDASPHERRALLEALGGGRAAALAARIIEEATPDA